MTDNKNRPVVNTRDKLMSVSIFKREEIKDGQLRKSYGACLQRSYKPKDAQNDSDYRRESINLFPDELLKISALCLRAYNDLTAYIQADRANNSANDNRPSQVMDDNEPPAWINDDIPFE